MIKKSIFLCLFLFVSIASNAMDMQYLFKALKKQPISKIDTLSVKESKAFKNSVASEFFPKVYGIASYEFFSSPTSLRPTTPTESAILSKENKPLPFSRTISQIGLQINMPIISYSLYNLLKKTEYLYQGSMAKKRINFVKNQAALVMLNAKLKYLESLEKSLKIRKNSLESTLKRIEVGVKNGRFPEISQIKIESAIYSIELQLNQIKTDKNTVTAQIESLTSIKLTNSVPMKLIKSITKNNFYSLKPIEFTTQAKEYDLKSQKSKLLPTVSLQSNILRKFGKGYNNNENIIRNYASVGLYLRVPIFDKTIYSQIEKSKSDYLKSKAQLEQTKIELQTEFDNLRNSLKLINKSIKFAKKNITKQKELLKYAKVAFKVQRMTEEEYLRYENSILEAYVNLFSLKMKKWEIITKIAVINGKDLKEIVE